ncbi:hypothetical protein D3C78_935420 [compost metagenome]
MIPGPKAVATVASTAGASPLLAAHQVPKGWHQHTRGRCHADPLHRGIGENIFAGGEGAHTGPVTGKGLVDHLAVVRHGDIHRRYGPRQLGLPTHVQITSIHIEDGVELGIAAHGDLAEVVEHQVVGLAPGIDLHLVAQGQVTLEVKLGREAGIEDQLVVAAKFQLVDPVAAAAEVEPDVGRALMLEGLDVIGLQIAIDDAVVAHLQDLMQFEGQIAATARRRDLALPLHLEPIDAEGALALEGHGTVALYPQVFDDPVPGSHDHALATGRDIHGDVLYVARLEDGRPGIAIARDLQAAVDGDPGVSQLAVTRDGQFVDMEVSRPGETAVVIIPDGQLFGIDGRTIEVESGAISERQGIEAIGLARSQGRHATVASP